MLGGSLSGKRVLDLGCNAGFWSLCAIEHDCDYVLGIDGRQMHIDQANLVFEINKINKSRYDFHCDNFFNTRYEEIGKFDVVLCLGIFYHINKHINLLEFVSLVNTDILIIDTSLSTIPGSFLEIRWDRLENPQASYDYELVMFPTQRAVLDIVEQIGYTAVTLKPRFTDYKGALDYKDGSRRAFMCAKETDLNVLSNSVGVETEVLPIGRHRLDGVSGKALARALAARVLRKIGFGS